MGMALPCGGRVAASVAGSSGGAGSGIVHLGGTAPAVAKGFPQDGQVGRAAPSGRDGPPSWRTAVGYGKQERGRDNRGHAADLLRGCGVPNPGGPADGVQGEQLAGTDAGERPA